jgi:cyclophilin family peptidyl-prolyl cis-trans isomerase
VNPPVAPKAARRPNVPDSRGATGARAARPRRRGRRQDRTLWIAFGAVLVIIAITAAILLSQNTTPPAAATATPLAQLDVATAPPGATAPAGATDATGASGDRPLAAIAPEARNNFYSAPPPMTIDTSKSYRAIIKTEVGDIVVQLFADQAPTTVNSFVFLARQGYYDNVTFHRVLEGFMAQGGDPTGTGSGSPGYEFQNENQDARFDKAGQLAMANAGPNTNGSQFFITFGPAEQNQGLQGSGYTIFGEVVEGMDVLDQIKRRDPNTNPDFTGTVINRIDITES